MPSPRGGGGRGRGRGWSFQGVDAANTRAPWADIEPTSEETLRRALENKKARQAAEELLRTPPPSKLPDSARRSTGDLGGPATRVRRMSGLTLDGDDSLGFGDDNQDSERFKKVDKGKSRENEGSRR